MNGDASADDPRQRWLKYQAQLGEHQGMSLDEWLRHDFDEQMREEKRRNNRVVFWALLISVSLFVIMVTSPTWLVTSLSLLLGAWGLWGAWAKRPGRCVVCGRRTMLSGPSETYRAAPPYMYWKPQPRDMSIYACPEHMGPVILDLVHKRG